MRSFLILTFSLCAFAASATPPQYGCEEGELLVGLSLTDHNYLDLRMNYDGRTITEEVAQINFNRSSMQPREGRMFEAFFNQHDLTVTIPEQAIEGALDNFTAKLAIYHDGLPPGEFHQLNCQKIP